jgi:hypothetical protein
VIKNITDEWKSKSELGLGEKWCDIICCLKNEGISFRNLLLLFEFAVAIPGTNPEMERIFSVINALWTDENKKFKLKQ